MKDFVLSGYSCEDSGDLTGIEVTPTQGPVQTVQCGSLVTLQDKIIDRDTFGGLFKFYSLSFYSALTSNSFPLFPYFRFLLDSFDHNFPFYPDLISCPLTY